MGDTGNEWADAAAEEAESIKRLSESLAANIPDEQPVERAVKFVGPDTIEGLAIPFGGTFAGKDLVGEAFDAATDLCIEWFGSGGRPLLYDHGLDAAHKSNLIGRQTEFETRAEGVWAQSQLDLNAKYRKAVDRLIAEQALGYSSGAMPHLATKNSAGTITRWPWVELSLTPIPAEPSTLGVHYMKSAHDAIALLESVDVTIPDPLKAALSALDEWADTRDGLPADLSYADEGERLLLAAKAFAERSLDIASMRAKSGRAMSAANRARLVELRDRIATTSENATSVLSELDALLASTDPDPGAEKRLWEAVFEAMASEAERAGFLPH